MTKSLLCKILWLDILYKSMKHIFQPFSRTRLATVFLLPAGGISSKNGFSFFLEKCLAVE